MHNPSLFDHQIARSFFIFLVNRKYVLLEFGTSASLQGEHKVLKGEGKSRHDIKFSADNVPEKHVHEYLALALKASSEL